MKAYVNRLSPNCRKVLAVLNYLELDAEIIDLQFNDEDLKNADYLQINPNGMVPAIKDGDFTLWESNSINQYLCSKAPGNPLFPDEAQARANISRWQCWELAHYGPALGTILWETVAKKMLNMGEPDQSAIDGALPRWQRFSKVLEAQLEGKDFITGPQVTLADFSVGKFAGMIGHSPVISLDDYPNTKAWYERFDAVPAWAKTAPSA